MRVWFPVFALILLLGEVSHGQCWLYARSNTTSKMVSISMWGPASGAALGWYGLLWTSDGGSTWNPRQVPTDPALRVVSCVNESTWFVGAQGVILRTTDGGVHWESNYLPGIPTGLCFFDSLRGVASSYEHGLIVHTTNGGKAWYGVNYTPDNTYLYGLSFPDSLHGFAVGSTGGMYGLIMHSSDGGISWTTQRSEPYEYLFAVSFINPDTGYAVGQAALRTTDGGTTWSTFISTNGLNLNGISFLNSDHGVIVGQAWNGSTWDGIILETRDAGATWDTTIVPGAPLNAVRCLDTNACIVLGDGGTIIRKALDCSAGVQISLLTPANGLTFQPIVPIDTLRSAARFAWDFSPPLMKFAHSRFQLSTDSGFAGTLVRDTLVPVMGSAYNTSLVIGSLVPGEKYFWRVALREYGGAMTGWSETYAFTTSRSCISGLLFEDLDGDSVRDAKELAIPNWHVNISGKIQTLLTTDSLGRYSIAGIDSGLYTIAETPRFGGSLTYPPGGHHTVQLGVNDTVSKRDFGNFFPWNTISGVLFHDRNENGTRETGEEGLSNFQVVIEGENTLRDTVLTDSLGRYLFQRVDILKSTVSVVPQPAWEQIYPQLQTGRTIMPYQFGQTYAGMDFAFHTIPLRVKLTITVSDNTPFAHRDIWWGVRPEATYGIWGISPSASIVDFAEGEFEIPPRSYGLFDARFVDPRNTWTNFGAGSWTDMRGIVAVGKPDTFLVAYAPGILYGGGYPMQLQWSKDAVASSFQGSVEMVFPWGFRVDMKTTDHLSLYNTGYDYCYIIAQNPAIAHPETYMKNWNMVSLPSVVPDASVGKLFRTALSRAYSYSPSVGYIPWDTLVPRTGYWLKFAPGIDTLPVGGDPLRSDTLQLAAGWNLIGALGLPVEAGSLATDPPGIIGGDIYCYDGRVYFIADTLRPSKAYWVKATQPGSLFLGVSSLNSKIEHAQDTRQILRQSSCLTFRDAAQSEAVLYFRIRGTPGSAAGSFYELPPLPPDASFDARFASGRFLEEIREGEKGQYPIRIVSGVYPVRVEWKEAALKFSPSKATLQVGGTETPIRGDGSVSIPSPDLPVTLKLEGSAPVPSEFALGDNYPNPFNPATSIPYELPVVSYVKITVYTMLGQLIQTLVEGIQAPGYRTVRWNAAAFASGLYFYRMEAKSMSGSEKRFTAVKKLMLVR